MMSEKKTRNYSIEILRILAMIGIVMLHTQSKTGWLEGKLAWKLGNSSNLHVDCQYLYAD